MAIAPILTPFAMLLELVIFGMGVYAGYVQKRNYGYFFGFTFLVFALFDYFGSTGVTADTLAILNIIAILSALGGIYLVIAEKSERK